MIATARANTNIALIKYWGKRDSQQMLPSNSSISVTLDGFYTETQVEYQTGLMSDEFFLDGERVIGKSLDRVQNFMDRIRRVTGMTQYARIQSENHVPTEAGLASSSSAFSALALAATQAAGAELSLPELSRMARYGSGSACRSVYPGFVLWDKGTDEESCVAAPIAMEAWDDFRMIALMIDHRAKKLDSREAMKRTQMYSPYFEAWTQDAERMIQPMCSALQQHRFAAVGKLAQQSCLRMHASLLAAGQWYLQAESLTAMNRVQSLQDSGVDVYFTMDAGPNVKLLCEAKDVDLLLAQFSDFTAVVCRPGEGVKSLD